MGEYSNLFIGGQHITGWKNCVSFEASSLFTEDDFTEVPHPKWHGNWRYNQNDPRLKQMPCFQYQTSVGSLKDRLELLGFTLDKAQEAWDSGSKEALQISLDYAMQSRVHETDSKTEPRTSYDFWKEHYSNLTFNMWTGLMQQIIVEQIEPISHFDNQRKAAIEKINPLLCFILRGYGSSAHEFGFPSDSFDLVLRAMLEPLDSDTVVVLDCSPLVGWVEPDQYSCTPPKAVVLTEGTSDQRIIERSLRFLYPHLHGYFLFPDFEATNLQGSTGQLINITKAFVATGVRHKTIVLFDNDTAGHDALRILSGIQLPNEIRISVLPNIDLATSYPTIGPQGNMMGDINGVACSIELYLGRDILVEAEERLYPVRYTGYVQAMGKWQGEITNKLALQEKYLRLLGKAPFSSAIVAAHDWSGMELVLRRLIALYTEANSCKLQVPDTYI